MSTCSAMLQYSILSCQDGDSPWCLVAQVITASTFEWPIERQLYSGCDKAAAHNIGVVMATRLREAGLATVYWDIQGKRYHGRVKAFIDAVRDNGIRLGEL